VLTADEDQAGRIYELAGDESYTLSEFAAEISRQSAKPVAYKNLPEAEFKALLADSDVGASKGGLFDESRQLSKLIGRPTTPFAKSIAAALKG
jgi:NAD(P)H dehydrogenase (quinone)